MAEVDALNDQRCTGSLTLNGIPMSTRAWQPLDLTTLWMSPKRRGKNVVLPGVNGVVPYNRRPDETQHQIPMVIVGTVDRDGATFSNPWVGLESNINYLRTNVFDSMTPVNGALVMPSGANRFGLVQIDDFELGEHSNRAQYNAVLTITLPGGVFV